MPLKAENSQAEQSTVLIVSDGAEFSRAVTSRWQSERVLPAFTLVGGDLCKELDPQTFDLAIVGPVRRSVLPAVLKPLHRAGKPVICLCSEEHIAQNVRDAQPNISVLRQYEGWLDSLVLLASESLKRCEAMQRARQLEATLAAVQQQATLGRYMLDMRHTLNNTLTSVLGNSELLLLEPGSLSATSRSQVETIRNQTLRMHEILQRFSSLEKELSVIDKDCAVEAKARARGAGASAS